MLLKWILLVALSSCGVMDKNMPATSHLAIRGGVAGESRWSEELKFKRYSWYAELNLLFDLLIYPIDPTSPFWKWLSLSEQNDLLKCNTSLIILTYALDTDRISHLDLKQQFQQHGIEYLVLPTFNRNLKNHPDFTFHNLKPYWIQAACLDKSKPKLSSIEVVFPGFSTQVINF